MRHPSVPIRYVECMSIRHRFWLFRPSLTQNGEQGQFVGDLDHGLKISVFVIAQQSPADHSDLKCHVHVRILLAGRLLARVPFVDRFVPWVVSQRCPRTLGRIHPCRDTPAGFGHAILPLQEPGGIRPADMLSYQNSQLWAAQAVVGRCSSRVPGDGFRFH